MQINQHVFQRLHLDVPLLVGLMLLCGLGLVVLYSAGDQEFDIVIRQAMRMLLGFIVLFALAQFNINQLLRITPWLYGLGVLLLVAVILFGKKVMGAQRWLNLGFINFQPSEIMKLAEPLMVAWYLAQHPLPPSYGRLGVAMVLILLPFLLIAKQPDLGTALLVAASGMFVVLLSGLNWKLLVGIGTISLGSLISLWTVPPDKIQAVFSKLLHGYQLKRVMIFLNPESEPLKAGYHIIQSKIAIGSGGIYGKGWLNGTQSHLEFLPERTTDFIFAVFSEEFGLLGSLVLLTLYLFVISRSLYLAIYAHSAFEQMVAGALGLTFFVYVFVNIGMVTGALPVVGVPLPLISYGGTAVVTLFAGFGILMALHAYRKQQLFY
jgi:rod shape determining protein RodA